MTFRNLILATSAVVLTALPAAAQVKAPGPQQCMEDDGYGRYRPCDSSYMAANPNWRNSDRCMEDDGYGRYRPCDSSFKKEADKPKQ